MHTLITSVVVHNTEMFQTNSDFHDTMTGHKYDLHIPKFFFFLLQCHHMSFVDLVVLPPGHGRSVTDFWGWDTHEAQLRCPDGVWVVIEEDVVEGP